MPLKLLELPMLVRASKPKDNGLSGL
jgi:hypothetical protein